MEESDAEQDTYTADEGGADESLVTLEDTFGLVDQPPLPPQEEEAAHEEKQELRYEFPIIEEPVPVVPPVSSLHTPLVQPAMPPQMPQPIPLQSAGMEADEYRAPEPVSDAPIFFEEPIE